MSLQARLRHPLGERWIDLPERGVDRPLVVGRAGGADVQVPSATVAQKHCVLFVHEGQWVVQDVAAGAGTFVNGIKVKGAAFLRVGDVIALGPDAAAASVEIDPAGAAQGRAGQPIAAALPTATVMPDAPEAPVPDPYVAPYPPAPPYVPPPAVASGAYPAGYPVYPGGYAVPASAAPAPWPQHPAAAPVSDGSIADWPGDANPRYMTPRRKRRPSDGSNGVIVGMMLTLLIAAGTGYWLYRQREQKLPVVQSPVPPAPPPVGATQPAVRRDTSGAPPTIFRPDDPRAESPARGATVPTTRSTVATIPPATAVAGDTATGATPTGEASMDSGADPDATTAVPPAEVSPQDATGAGPAAVDYPAWKQVEAARSLNDEAKAILLFDDYGRTHPGAAPEKLRQYTENMLDRIWFERIENLCEQREEFARKIAEVDKDMAEETDAAHKSGVLVPLRKQYVGRLGNVEEELKQKMKYQGASTPNLLDEAEIEKLRQSRDAQYYASWKNGVLAHIRRTHGELPWVTVKSR